MALKLRRQAEVITNENLAHLDSRRDPKPLRPGAGSFKRVLGSSPRAHTQRQETHHVEDPIKGVCDRYRGIAPDGIDDLVRIDNLINAIRLVRLDQGSETVIEKPQSLG